MTITISNTVTMQLLPMSNNNTIIVTIVVNRTASVVYLLAVQGLQRAPEAAKESKEISR